MSRTQSGLRAVAFVHGGGKVVPVVPHPVLSAGSVVTGDITAGEPRLHAQ